MINPVQCDTRGHPIGGNLTEIHWHFAPDELVYCVSCGRISVSRIACLSCAATTGLIGLASELEKIESPNGLMFAPVISTSQILNGTSKIDLVHSENQCPIVLPRVPGIGKDQVVRIAPDFDDTLEIGA
jgi:hypothetical protein